MASLANLAARQIDENEALTEPSGPVFRRPDGEPYADRKRVVGGQIKTAWRTACLKAGFYDVIAHEPRPNGGLAEIRRVNLTPHDLRHTWATWLYAETRDLLLLKELGGWKTLAMVQRYAHVNPDHLKPAIEMLPSRAEPAKLQNRLGTTLGG